MEKKPVKKAPNKNTANSIPIKLQSTKYQKPTKKIPFDCEEEGNSDICSYEENEDIFNDNHSSGNLEGNFSKNPLIKYIDHGANQDLHVLSVIITILSEDSYDKIFTKIPQTSPEGRVAVFQINPYALRYFNKKFEDPNFIFEEEFVNNNNTFVENFSEIFDYLTNIEPECVLFNYECCGGVGDLMSFPEKSETLKLIDFSIKKGFYFMFSDFSLKTLLFDWDENILGKNPFKEFGENNKFYEMKFDPETLKNSDSEQLKTVGNLCPKGELTIKVMGGTIVFGLDKDLIDKEKYDLKVLTIMDNLNSLTFKNDEKYANKKVTRKEIDRMIKESIEKNGDKDEIGKLLVKLELKENEITREIKGVIGHVVLNYKSGGKIFLSAGHWIKLSKVNVDLEDLKLVSKNIYSNAYDDEIEEIENDANCSNEVKREKYSQLASQVIKKSANCKYSKKMVYKKKK